MSNLFDTVLVANRGEIAVRGSIIDVFPSTADAPVRIDLWGDEIERLCEFSVADQRATVDLETSCYCVRKGRADAPSEASALGEARTSQR